MKRMSANCGLCGADKPAHAALNHEFSLSGQLIPKKAAPAPRTMSTIDIPLRLLLIDLGVITAEDLAMKEAEIVERLQARRDAPDSTNEADSAGDLQDRVASKSV